MTTPTKAEITAARKYATHCTKVAKVYYKNYRVALDAKHSAKQALADLIAASKAVA